MKTEIPHDICWRLCIDIRQGLHKLVTRKLVTRRPLPLWLLLTVVLVSVGAARGDVESDPQEPKQTAAEKPAKKTVKKSATKTTVAIGPEGPSSDHPGWPLLVWSDGPAVEWRKQAGACAVEAEKLIAGLEKPGASKGVEQRVSAINRAHVLLIQLARLAARLQTWSEPAGMELELRRERLNGRLGELVGKIRTERPQMVADIQAASRERCQKAKKTLEPIKKLHAAGKIEAAEGRLIKLYDDLANQGAWYPVHDPHPPLQLFEYLLRDWTAELLPQRQQAARDAMSAYRARQTPNYAELLDEVGTATAALAAGRKFDHADQMLDGPQALALFLGRWQELQFNTLHVRALDCALAQFKNRNDDASTVEPYGKFEQDLAGALVKLIDADAASVKAPDVADRYAAYVQTLAGALSVAGDESLTREFQAALDRLTAKSPPLAAQVEAYRLATSDMLRWRARVAAAERVRAEAREPSAKSFSATLKEPAPAIVRAWSAELLGKPNVGRDLIGAAKEQRATGAMAKDRTYCVVRLDSRVQAASAALRTALLCADSKQPLNLEGAVALLRAERGDLQAVGGTVKRIELESLVPLWAHCDTWGLARLDRQPDAASEPVCLRIELEPRWYQQTHAFIELEPDKP